MDDDQRFMPFDQYHGSWMFTDRTLPMPPERRATIRPLHPHYSTALWQTWISRTHRHHMAMRHATDSFLTPERMVITHYAADWQHNEYARVQQSLQQSLPWNDAAVVYWFWSAGSGVQTHWSTVVQHWLNFLFADEAAILVNPLTPAVAIFSLGTCWRGQRTSPCSMPL